MHARQIVIWSLLALAALVGCSRNQTPPPATSAVDGKIVHADGSAYAGGGLISFKHETAHGVTVIGDVKPDGAFTLRSLQGQHLVQGAPEGSYAVSIMPHVEDQAQQVDPIHLKKRYEISSGANSLTVNVDD